MPRKKRGKRSDEAKERRQEEGSALRQLGSREEIEAVLQAARVDSEAQDEPAWTHEEEQTARVGVHRTPTGDEARASSHCLIEPKELANDSTGRKVDLKRRRGLSTDVKERHGTDASKARTDGAILNGPGTRESRSPSPGTADARGEPDPWVPDWG